MSSLLERLETPPEYEGTELAELVGLMLFVLALLSGVVGFVLFAGSYWTEYLFVWETATPLSAALLGAGFLGAVPMMVNGTLRPYWEDVRIAIMPAMLLVTGMLLVSMTYAGETLISGGPIVGFLLSVGWFLAMAALPVALVIGLVAQAREPTLPIARLSPIPRLLLPAVGIEGAAGLFLGVGFLVSPEWWMDVVPWELTPLDTRALGVWALVLGTALLQALVDDDLDRVRPGLAGVLAIGFFGLVATAWHHGDITWSGWPAWMLVLFLTGLFLTGLIGMILRQRAAQARAATAEQTKGETPVVEAPSAEQTETPATSGVDALEELFVT